MEKADEYRSLLEQLIVMSQEGFKKKGDIRELLDILKKIGSLKIRTVSRRCTALHALIPRLRKRYLNMDEGDTFFLEDDLDYVEIKRRLDILVAKLSKEV